MPDGEQWWGLSHCTVPVGKVAMAPAGQDALPEEGSRLGQGLLVDEEMGLDTCMTAGEYWLRTQLIGTLSSEPFVGSYMIIFTFQYVLKMDCASVFYKDLRPFFFHFISFLKYLSS